jgi:hypothetical protein
MIGLRNPKFGNTWTSDSKSSLFMSLDSEKIIAPNSILIKRFSVEFEALTTQQVVDLENFFIMMAGTEVELEDHERNIWLGFILNPNPEIIAGRDGCQYQTRFEFEGQITGVVPP